MTTFGARNRIEQINQICSAYISGSDLFRDSNSEIGQTKFITCIQYIEEQYSFFLFQAFFLNTFVLFAVIYVFSSHHMDSE